MSLGIAAVFLVSACSDRKVRKMQDFYVVQYQPKKTTPFKSSSGMVYLKY